MGVRADGSVVCYPESINTLVNTWKDVTDCEAGNGYMLGLKKDGTVLFAGNQDKIRRDVAQWRDIAEISAGKDFAAGRKTDGTLVFAGEFSFDWQ